MSVNSGLKANPPGDGPRPLMVSHLPSKNPQNRLNALRTSTEISWPSPVACFQSAERATLRAAKPIAAAAPKRIELGRIGSDPEKLSLPPESDVFNPMSFNTSFVPACRSKSGDVAGLLSFVSSALVNRPVAAVVFL